MTIYKIRIKRLASVDITSITIPTYSAYKANCKETPISESWWLKEDSSLKLGGAYVINAHNIQVFVDKTQMYGVRPLVFFAHNDDLDIGDEFIWANHLFSVVFEGTAICKTVIGYSPYNYKNNISTTFEESDLFAFLNEWKNKNIKEPVFKVTDVESVMAFGYCSLLRQSDAMNNRNSLFNDKRYPFWIRSSIDEFTGYRIEHNSNYAKNIFFKTPYTKICHVYPALYFLDPTLKEKFNDAQYFLYNDRLFEPLDRSNGIALSLNSIGVSCYSTGIASPEESVFEDSEIKEMLDRWNHDDLPF